MMQRGAVWRRGAQRERAIEISRRQQGMEGNLAGPIGMLDAKPQWLEMHWGTLVVVKPGLAGSLCKSDLEG